MSQLHVPRLSPSNRPFMASGNRFHPWNRSVICPKIRPVIERHSISHSGAQWNIWYNGCHFHENANFSILCFAMGYYWCKEAKKSYREKIGLPEGVPEQLVNSFPEVPEGSLLFRLEIANISILFFAMGYYGCQKAKKLKEQYRTSGRCDGAACQLLPRGPWRKSAFLTGECEYLNSVFRCVHASL